MLREILQRCKTEFLGLFFWFCYKKSTNGVRHNWSTMSSNIKHADTVPMPHLESGFKEDDYKEWLMQSLLHVPAMDSDELNLEFPTFDTDSTMPSIESEHHHQLDVSLDSWLRCLVDGESEGFAESCTMQPELMLSPPIIRAPLRSIRADKHALRCDK